MFREREPLQFQQPKGEYPQNPKAFVGRAIATIAESASKTFLVNIRFSKPRVKKVTRTFSIIFVSEFLYLLYSLCRGTHFCCRGDSL